MSSASSLVMFQLSEVESLTVLKPLGWSICLYDPTSVDRTHATLLFLKPGTKKFCTLAVWTPTSQAFHVEMQPKSEVKESRFLEDRDIVS